MNNVNKTLYIPLYGKAYASRKGLFLRDSKAEEIWAAEGFELRGKAKSKWLAYYMGIRAAVFDHWVKEQTACRKDTAVLHIGCGLDSRILRVNTPNCKWYDIDFPDVITERRRHFEETERYRMIEGDIRYAAFLNLIPETDRAVVVMEGVSMYLTADELRAFTDALSAHFKHVSLLTDSYSVLAAKLSKYRNPINTVGVTEVYGTDDPKAFETHTLRFIKEHDTTPEIYLGELHGFEKKIFKKLYAGNFSKKLYRLFEYGSRNRTEDTE